MSTHADNRERRPRGRRLLRDWRFWIATAVAFYTLVGFLVVPFVAKRVIVSQVREYLGCETRIKTLRFNPYTFNVKARDFELTDRQGQMLAGGRELFVNFGPWPLVKHVAALEEIRVTR